MLRTQVQLKSHNEARIKKRNKPVIYSSARFDCKLTFLIVQLFISHIVTMLLIKLLITTNNDHYINQYYVVNLIGYFLDFNFEACCFKMPGQFTILKYS